MCKRGLVFVGQGLFAEEEHCTAPAGFCLKICNEQTVTTKNEHNGNLHVDDNEQRKTVTSCYTVQLIVIISEVSNRIKIVILANQIPILGLRGSEKLQIAIESGSSFSPQPIRSSIDA
ncbi:MAG: hypothetical protein GY696_24470 [Gammaproteobacteria bacterium]|nr:hypothetical protein [Gammaproteobacteria bacterium]